MSAATVIRLRSRFDNSLRSQTSSNSTRSVSSTSFGEKSPISFLAPSDGFGMFVLLEFEISRVTPRPFAIHLSGSSFARCARDSVHPAHRSLRWHVRSPEPRLLRVQSLRLRCFLLDDAVWLCPEWERSKAFLPAAMPARFAQASLSSLPQTCRVEPRSPDSHPCSPDGSAE